MERVGRVGQQVSVLVDGAALRGDVGPQRRECPLEASRAVGDQERGGTQPARDEIVKDLPPRRLALAAHVLHGQQDFLPVAAHAEHDQQ